MRLRIAVRRHGLPETPIIWNVDSQTSTVAQLLEQVNEIVPIESADWGLEDYSVELKGSNGVNFECLHFQPVGKVMKEDDEVIIRPLLTQDLKIRKISGRHQISADGKHLVDGLAFGRPLLRRPDRPAVKIPPRKRPRITYNEGEEEDEGLLVLKEKEEREAEGGDSVENGNRELVLHADFEDDDSEDEDFVPGKDEELGEDTGEDEVMEKEPGEQEGQMESAKKSHNGDDEDESALHDVSDEATCTKIRKLHSAFPTSPLAVCKYVLNGSGGDVGEAYGTMSLGFQPVIPASAVAETLQDIISVPKTRSKKRKAGAEEEEAPDSMLVEAAQTADSLLLEHYDQNGLPPGSISLGKALSHMAEAVQNSSGRSRPTSRGSNLAFSNKSVRFSLDEGLTNGFTSTPATDPEPYSDNSEGESEDSSSDVTSSSGSSFSEEDSSSGDESREDAEVSDTSSSGSDSDSSSDSSSDNDVPEETSSKATNASVANPATISTGTSPPKLVSRTAALPGEGKKSTISRNRRRRAANMLRRFKEKGILPAGTTSAEFMELSEVNSDTSPEDAAAALEAVRAAKKSVEINQKTGRAIEKSKEFETRRQALFASLESGGIEVGPESSKKASKQYTAQTKEVAGEDKPSKAVPSVEDVQQVSNAFLTSSETHLSPASKNASQNQVSKDTANPAFRMSPKAVTPQSFVISSKPTTLSATKSAYESKPPTPASESAQSATSSRRAKLDLGAGRRMLFGALGIKAPKSKNDEEKVRNDLMKDIRPVLAPKAPEKAPGDDDEEIEDQDPEAWREKINYRAVECCYNGVELSEPPFPFVQRWDPQQQGAWSQKGKNGGKRKKNQRDESQYYQDEGRLSKKQKQRKGKHTYIDQQEYFDASYEPSYQEDSIMESEEPTHQTRPPNDDIEGELTQQLMNDLDEEASTQDSQGPEDLAALPKDPAILPDLQDGEIKPGMTIAFKQLTMSEETKWQPEISAYRTAVVNAVLDGGELQLTLALRDRINSEKSYDTETGERIYGKFDMPDQDDDEDEEDDGIRNLTFSEMVEPKVVQEAPADLGVDNTQIDGTVFPKLPKLGARSVSQTFSHDHEHNSADAQFSHVSETPLTGATKSILQKSKKESSLESLHANAPFENQEPNSDSSGSMAEPSTLEVKVEEAAPQKAEKIPVDVSVTSEDQEGSVATSDKGKSKEIIENYTEESVILGDQEGATPDADADISIGKISTDARLKISQMMTDAGFRSSIPPFVMKDIRPTGMESPGDAKVFEKLINNMTETKSNPPYSPKFHGLNSSSPIKKLRQVSTDRQPSSSPVRVQSSWQTVERDSTSSPPMNDVKESNWFTDDEPSNAPLRASSKHITKKTKPTSKMPNLGKAQALWEALQPREYKTSVSSKAALGPSNGLDGTNENDGGSNVQYPKLSAGSSFTSQISDHGRQLDLTFNESGMTNGGTSVAAAFENDTFMNQQDDQMSDVEPELTLVKSAGSRYERQQQADPFFIDEPKLQRNSSEEKQDDDPFIDGESQPSKSKTDGSAKSRSKIPEITRDSSSSDDVFPTLEEVLSQRDTTRETTTPVRPKPVRQIKAEKPQNKARDDASQPAENEETTPKVSRKTSRPSNRQHSLPSGFQVRKSPRHSQVRGSQRSASQSHPSQSQSKFIIPQGSQVMDLTLTSSDVEEEEEEAVVSEAEQPKRFQKYPLDEDDDDHLEEESGWVQKKSSSQKAIRTRRQSSKDLRSSSQSSLNTSRRKKTARF